MLGFTGRSKRKAPEAYRPYEEPRSRELAREVIALMAPADLRDREEAVREAVCEGQQVEIREAVCRVVETPDFRGSVVATFFNDDATINPGYERGTQRTLKVLGCLGSAAIDAEFGDSLLTLNQYVNESVAEPVLQEVLTALQQEAAERADGGRS